jgi:hypothetical protein
MNRELIIERSKRIEYDYRYGDVEVKVGKVLMALDGYKPRDTWKGTLELLYNEFLTTAEKMEFECNCNFYRSRDKVIYLIKKYFIKTNNLLNNE